MEKKVTRKEVNIFVDSKDPRPTSGSSSKFANQGKNLIVGSSTYSIPNADSLASKYGIELDEVAKQGKVIEELQSALENKQQKILDLEDSIKHSKEKLSEKNQKIEHLCVLLEALEPPPGMNPGKLQEILQGKLLDEEIDLRDGKIVSLAKKSHNLSMHLNKEKFLNSQLNEEISDWKRKYELLIQDVENVKLTMKTKNETKVYTRSSLLQQQQQAKEGSSTFLMDGNNDLTSPNDSNGVTPQQLQKQLKETNKQNEEMKKKIKEITEENAILTKTLKKELGDNITLEQAVDSGWRGRAQQIIMLKSKVKVKQHLPSLFYAVFALPLSCCFLLAVFL
jgi:regulator of replication initiation timing/uncharacterized coiled-coil protein SlyX